MNREQALHRIVHKTFPKYPESIVANGDDAAVLSVANHSVVNTDTYVNRIHFDTLTQSPADIAHKTAVGALSDIFAMGAKPKHIFLNLSLPDSISIDWCQQYASGLQKLLGSQQVFVAGGDTTATLSEDLVVTYTVMGELMTPELRPLTQSHAKIGDHLAISSPLGGAIGGFLVSREKTSSVSQPYAERLKQNFLRPQIDVKKISWIARQHEVSAATDLSDGLLKDTQKIIRNSGIGFSIDVEKVPINEDLKKLETSTSLIDLALLSGEEYALLYTISDLDSFTAKHRKALGMDPCIIGRASGSTLELKCKGEIYQPETLSAYRTF